MRGGGGSRASFMLLFVLDGFVLRCVVPCACVFRWVEYIDVLVRVRGDIKISVLARFAGMCACAEDVCVCAQKSPQDAASRARGGSRRLSA